MHTNYSLTICVSSVKVFRPCLFVTSGFLFHFLGRFLILTTLIYHSIGIYLIEQFISFIIRPYSISILLLTFCYEQIFSSTSRL